jgi:sugar O-acyltransferase (sialic acid O-acetyltransferase NeuD family)
MIIVGAGGHARELLEVLLDNAYQPEITFYDDQTGNNTLLHTYRILHSLEEVLAQWQGRDFCVGIGNPQVRQKFFELFSSAGFIPQSILSCRAAIGKYADLGIGLNVMPFSSITNLVKIGKGTLIHSYCSIHHDVEVGQFCEISPGARVLGGGTIGDLTRIGTNAVVLPKVKIGSNCCIGAGAVVTKDVPDNETFVGVPAKKVEKHEG